MEKGIHRELLLADIAVELGLVRAVEMAVLLARYWEKHDGSVLAGLSEQHRVRVEAEYERLVGDAGDARTALAERGVNREIPASMAPDVSHAISEGGTRIRAPLRQLDRQRYLGFTPLGEGGMGVVYLALDSELNRRVAFKMVRAGTTDPLAEKSGPVTDHAVARFLQEAVVTGGLEHPGIVPVYEVGRTPSGVPYYTMRLVKGERTLEDAIAEAQTTEERLPLLEAFLKVCDAVGYAHSRGVIHRDLKPANVALGRFGEVVVLDWGLAKMKSRPDVSGTRWQERLDEIRDATDLQTMTSALGTPGYMSPEAARGEIGKIDRRSDVFSLGAMLHRILTGRLPFEFERFADYVVQLKRGIQSIPAAPPGLARICLQALARKRNDRYQDVGEIATAIRAWQTESAVDREVDALQEQAEETLSGAESLEGDALLRQLDRAIGITTRIVDLRPHNRKAPELRAQARDLRAKAIAQRERLGRKRLLKRVAVAGLAVATVATVVVALLIDDRRREAEDAQRSEEEHRLAAEADRTRSEDMARFMLNDLHDELVPVGRLDLLGSVARKSLEYYESLPTENVTDAVWFGRALALGQIGEVLFDTGELVEALESCRESQRILGQLLLKDPDNPEWRKEFATAANRTGDVLQETGDLDGASTLYETSVGVRRDLAGDGARWDLTRSLDRVADVAMRQGDRDRAREFYAESLEIRRDLVAHDPGNVDWLQSLSFSVETAGELALQSSDIATALAAFEEVRSIRRELLAIDATRTDWQSHMAGCVFRIGWCYELRGETPAALRNYREALAIYRRLAGLDPSRKDWQRNVALSLEREADLLAAGGDALGAKERYLDALEIKRLVVLRDPTATRARHDVSVALVNLGDLSKSAGDLSAAMPYYTEALETARALVERDPSNTEWKQDVLDALFRVGQVRAQTDRHSEAKRAYEEALAIARELSEADPENAKWQRNTGLCLGRLGNLARDTGDTETARVHHTAALEIKRRLAARDPENVDWQTDLAWTLGWLGAAAKQRGDDAEALALYEEAVAARRRVFGSNTSATHRRELALNLFNVGLLLEADGRTVDALTALREGTEIHRGAAGYENEHHFWTAAYTRVVLSAGAETPSDHMTAAYALYEDEDYAASADAWEVALDDEDIRSDLRNGHLYNAVCSAALAGRTERALAWLADDLMQRRASLSQAQLSAFLEHVRVNDPDLASLRGMPGFDALFED